MNTNKKNYKDHLKEIILKSKILLLLLKIINFFLKFFNRIPHFILEADLRNKLVVREGPFKGLIYPEPRAAGNFFFPVILGQYETHLHKYIMEFKNKKYDNIINIGAAEGYYAVGLAMLFPNTKVVAIDIDEESLNFLEKMAKLNKVDKYVKTYKGDAKMFLKSINANSKNLIMCDCEGCEFDIFSSENVDLLKKSDLIVEMHYKNKNPKVERDEFISRFDKYHEAELQILSKSGRENNVEDYPFLRDLPVKYALRFINVNRAPTADWIIFSSKENL